MRKESNELLASVLATVPGWVERSVMDVLVSQGIEADDKIKTAIAKSAADAQIWVDDELRKVLEADDESAGTPLTVLRGAARFPTKVLAGAGAAPVERDEFTKSHFPNDDYNLTPAAWADVDDELVEPAIRWGAARVHAHLQARK